MRLNRTQQRDILATMMEEARRRGAQSLPITEVVWHVGLVRDDARSAARMGLTIRPAPEQESRQSMNKDQEESSATTDSSPIQDTEQEAALYGPPGRGEYTKGDVIRFKDVQSGQEFVGEVLFIRAPSPAIQGGKIHPTVYMVLVEGEHLPRAIYPGDVIENSEKRKNKHS
jgi:hypothetical protein